MRKLASILATAGVLVSLSACAASPSAFADCGPSGNAALVTAEGSFGADPAAEFPTPLVSTKPETAQVRPGDGAQVAPGSVIDGTVSIYFGDTGEAVGSGSGPITGTRILAGTSDFIYPFTEAMTCAEVGARVVTTGTAADLFGPEALGLDPEMTLVVVTDISTVYLGKAEGSVQVAQAGMPAIVLAPNGQPGFTFPDSAQPDEFRTDLLIRGSGAAVEDGDSVVLNYTTIAWDGQAVSDSSWSGGFASPVILALDGTDTPPFTLEVKEAIIGQSVGSQLLISVPGESGLVYVIDVLGIAE